MRIRLSEKQLSMLEDALYHRFLGENGEMDCSPAELELYDKVVSAHEKEKSGASVSE